jgi:hypothetical protein
MLPKISGSLRRTAGDCVALVTLWSWIVVRAALDSVSSAVDRVAAAVVTRAAIPDPIDMRPVESELHEAMGGVL